MTESLTARVALVTGCGSIGPGWGNGKATSVLFAREGAAVFGVDRNRIGLSTRAAAINLRRIINLGLHHGPEGWTIT